MNYAVGFRAVVQGSQTVPLTLRLTASTLYRVTVNGKFLGHGPARAAHGYYRVDEWDLGLALTEETNVIGIEVAGYNVNSFYLLDQPSFLQAEILAGGAVLAATGDGMSFRAVAMEHRVQKVQRFSFQRPFIEACRLNSTTWHWRTEPDYAGAELGCALQPVVKLLPRGLAYPQFGTVGAAKLAATGTAWPQPNPNPVRDRSLTDIGKRLRGFPMQELVVIPSDDCQHFVFEMKGVNRHMDANTP